MIKDAYVKEKKNFPEEGAAKKIFLRGKRRSGGGKRGLAGRRDAKFLIRKDVAEGEKTNTLY